MRLTSYLSGKRGRAARCAGSNVLALWFATVPFAASALATDDGVPQSVTTGSVSSANSTIEEHPVDDAALGGKVNALFDLRASSLIRLDLPESPEEGLELSITVDGENMRVLLAQHSILSPHFRLLVQVDGGQFIEETPEPVRTLRGWVLDYPDSLAAGALLEDGLSVRMSLPDGREYWIEPVASRFPLVDRSIHVLYRAEDVNPSGGVCANETGPVTATEPSAAVPRGAACGTGLCFAELAVDADFDYFSDYGTTTAVSNRIQTVINGMNVEYERDVDITHVISSIVIRTSDPSDPYTSTNSDTLVGQVRSEWNTNFPDVPRDITQLFTGKEIDGDTIGQAYNIAVVCTNQAYSYSQSDCCGSLACSTDLHAHENGHVWGGTHCNPCAGTTMHTPLQCANVFFSNSITEISNHRDSRACLATSGTYMPPFSDAFPSTTIDTTKWSIVANAQINTLGTNEPSAPNSLNIDGNDSITSVPINLSMATNAVLSYWWQRTGGGDSPENGEDLRVEYLSNQNVWTLLAAHPGAGSDTEPYHFESFVLPADAKHAFFRLRFKGTSTATNGTDDFFVDDVLIDPGDIFPPAPNPMSFSILPTPQLPDETHQLVMEATEATDATGPISYLFSRTNGPTEGNSSGWQASRTWVATVATPNSPWIFACKARDGAATPNATNYSPTAIGYTAIETPTDVTASSAAGDRISVTALGAFTSLSAQQSGLYFEVLNDQLQPVGIGANTWTLANIATTFEITGLAPSTQYSVRVKARNRASHETPFTSIVNVTTTDLIVPGAPILGDAQDVSMSVSINANGNLPGTQYAIRCVAASPSDATWEGRYVDHANGLPSATESWSASVGPVTVLNLQLATQYTFHVKARNPSLQESAFGPSAALSTIGLITPGAPILSDPTITTLSLQIQPTGNPPQMQYAIQCVASTPADAAWIGAFVHHATGASNGSAEDWQPAGAPITVTGLSPNVEYAFAVKARNPSATGMTPLGSSSALATRALTPGQPVIEDYPLDQAVITVTPDADPLLDNPLDTEFAIQCGAASPPDAAWDGKYLDADGNPGLEAVWRTSSAWGNAVAQGLHHEAVYPFAVKARNRDGLETAIGPAASAETGADCNFNAIADARELAECTGQPACGDCNENGIPDACEVGFEAAQWASSLIDFSSQYEDLLPAFGAVQTLGLPNVPYFGDNPFAWAPANTDNGLEFVTVGFTTPVFADGISVRENLSNGFVVRVEVVRVDDSLIEVWPLATGETDDTPTGSLADFVATWPQTADLVKGVRVTIDTNRVPQEYEEIDAIRLTGRVPGTLADDNANGVPDACEAVASPPNAPMLTQESQIGMDVAISADANPANAEYALQCTATAPFDVNWDGQFVDASGASSASEAWQTAAQWGTTGLSGMQPQTQYTFAAKARLPGGGESALGPSASLATLPLPTGACCRADGACDTLTESACGIENGVYQGDDTDCVPNPCPQPCLRLGDVFVDDDVNGLDIAAFVRAKLDETPLPGENPACADFGTGDIESDTAEFVAVLMGL